jgi:large subunit ribosomal protein L24
MHIKVNDTVEVITGDDRGSRGKVLAVDRAAGKLTVEGANRMYKHVRRTQKNPQGGRLSKEMPLPMSNVLLVCGTCGVATRTAARYENDGSKHRYCKKCGADNGQVAPARGRYAKK